MLFFDTPKAKKILVKCCENITQKGECPNIRGVLQNIHSFNLLDVEFLCEYERVRLR